MSAASSLFAGLLCLCTTLTAQSPPRFTLPEVPFDYFPVPAPGAKAIPARNDALPLAIANRRAALGRVLFYDVELSATRTRSCGSCHRQEHAFADDRRFSRGARAPTARNTMPLQNLGQRRAGFFWDERAAGLELAVLLPITNHAEMGMTMPAVVERLQALPDYAPLFTAAFGDAGISEARVGWALAQFVRALVSQGSRYDEGLVLAGGDVDADFPNFTAAENRGKALFVGTGSTRRHSCAECHLGHHYGPCGHSWTPLPQNLQAETSRNNGLDAGKQDDDPGRAGVTGLDADRGKFLAPSLRNIAVTAPYMHDGRFATLDEVMQFYATGVRATANLDPVLAPTGRGGWGGGRRDHPLQLHTASLASPLVDLGLNLTPDERHDLVAFLHTLTDRTFLSEPRFADPFVAP